MEKALFTLFIDKFVFGFGVVVFLYLMVTFCRFAMGGIFTTNIDSEHKTFGYHKTVKRRRNPAYCQCAVIVSGSCPLSLQTIVSIEFLCHCRVSCALCFLFFEALEKKNIILFWVGEVEALLQFLVCAVACAN